MPQSKKALLKKIESLPAAKVAEAEDFVDFIASRERESALTRAAQETSGPSFAHIWNNAEDDVYDAL
jgi:hypothetical protein